MPDSDSTNYGSVGVPVDAVAFGMLLAKVDEIEATLVEVRRDQQELAVVLGRFVPRKGQVSLAAPWSRFQTAVVVLMAGSLAAVLTFLGGNLWRRVEALESFASFGARVTAQEVLPVVRCVEDRFQERLIALEAGLDLPPADATKILITRQCVEELKNVRLELLRRHGP